MKSMKAYKTYPTLPLKLYMYLHINHTCYYKVKGHCPLTVTSLTSWSIPPATVSPRPWLSSSLWSTMTEMSLSSASSRDWLASSISFSSSPVDSRMVELELSEKERSRSPRWKLGLVSSGDKNNGRRQMGY